MAMKPMDMRDPKYVRQVMQTSYERYIDGTDMLPRVGFSPEATAERFPRKTQPIAAALLRAWGIINQDRDYFDSATRSLVAKARHKNIESEELYGISIVRIGLNAVKMGTVTAIPRQEPHVEITEGRRDEFIEEYGGKVIELGGGKVIRLTGDMLSDHPDFSPDVCVVRASNVSAIYVASQYQAAS